MKIGLIPVNVAVDSLAQLLALAQGAEVVGVESLWTFEHAMVPLAYQSRYPYDRSGKMPVTPETHFIDPLIALTAIAAQTKTIRLATGINILPQSNPLLLAKQAASLDLLSKGRLMLGLGIGWLREEFVAMGVPFEGRGARFDDYVQAMRKVWSGEVVQHKSEFLDWQGFKSYPLPAQSAIPIIIGGSKGKAFERIAKYGEGWFAPTTSPKELAPLIEQLKIACQAEGRDVSSVEISAMWLGDGGLDAVKEYRQLGVQRLVVPTFMLGGNTPEEGLAKLGDEIIAKLP